MHSKKHKRFKLLLDEGLHLPGSYPNLNNLHELLHVSQINLKGKKDEEIFKYAERKLHMVIVFNTKDFKKLIRSKSPSVISLSTNLPDTQADLKICKALKSLKPTEQKGHLIAITSSGIKVTRVINNEFN